MSQSFFANDKAMLCFMPQIKLYKNRNLYNRVIGFTTESLLNMSGGGDFCFRKAKIYYLSEAKVVIVIVIFLTLNPSNLAILFVLFIKSNLFANVFKSK